MIIGTAIITIYAPWAHSLKEKRSEVKSLCAKVRTIFNVSIAEVDEQDTHQKIVLGIACAAGCTALADSIIDKVLNFIEVNTKGEIIRTEREIR